MLGRYCFQNGACNRVLPAVSISFIWFSSWNLDINCWLIMVISWLFSNCCNPPPHLPAGPQLWWEFLWHWWGLGFQRGWGASLQEELAGSGGCWRQRDICELSHGAVMVCPRRRRSSLQNLLVHRHFHHECCIYNYNFLNMSHFQTPGGETKGSNSEITGSIWKLSNKICNTQQYYPRIGVWFGWFHRVGNGWPLGLRVLGMGWGWAATVGQGELYLWNTWTWMIYIYILSKEV